MQQNGRTRFVEQVKVPRVEDFPLLIKILRYEKKFFAERIRIDKQRTFQVDHPLPPAQLAEASMS